MTRLLTFRFDTFGDLMTASSRLRAWRLSEFLAKSGHRVSMNKGTKCDVYVCQKVRPFDFLREFRAAGKLIVYDFDDHLLLEGVESHGVKEEVVAFMNAVDLVTVGSEYLGEAARRYHSNVFVLENPVDIKSAELVRGKTVALERVGWFGSSAGLSDLRFVKVAEPVETVTRGGDIEFDLKSVDQALTEFDLLLFPVELSKWNLAKNANRMTKAVALGVPILATATPSHIRAVDQFGLDERFLVHEGERWDDKIDGLRQDFDAVQELIARARGIALELYSMERIGGTWLQQIERALDAKDVAATPSVASDESLKDVALVAIAYRVSKPSPPDGQLDRISFGSRNIVTPKPKADYLELFDRLWETICSVEQDWILLKPEDFHPTYGFAGEVRRALRDEPQRHLFVVRSQELGLPADAWDAYAKDLRGTLCQQRDPGIVLVRKAWLRQQPWRPAECFSYWSWLLVVQALSEGAAGVITTPVSWRSRTPAITNICAEYARWAKLHGERQAELPFPDTQWRRLGLDVLSSLAERLPIPVSAAFAWLASDPMASKKEAGASARALGRLEQELAAVYASSSWRLTSPLRITADVLRRIGTRSRGRP